VLGVAEGSVTFGVRDRDGVSSDELGVCGTVLGGGCDPSSVTVRFDQAGRGGADQARLVVAVR
jgi:hypothetical protein